jgi:hypothetical protein
LRKAHYGLKQGERQWPLHLHDVTISLQLKRAGYDPALFISHDTHTLVLMWVDDLFIFGSPESCRQFTSSIMSKFKSHALGEAKWLLGMAVSRNKTEGTLTLSHEQMINSMLQWYGLDQRKLSSIPMGANLIVGPDPHRNTREKIQTELSQADPISSASKTLLSKLDQIQSDARLLCESESIDTCRLLDLCSMWPPSQGLT